MATRMLWDLHGAKPAGSAQLPGRPDVTVEVLIPDAGHVPLADNDAEIIDQTAAVAEMTGSALLGTCDIRQLYRAAAMGVTAVRVPRRDDNLP